MSLQENMILYAYIFINNSLRIDKMLLRWYGYVMGSKILQWLAHASWRVRKCAVRAVIQEGQNNFHLWQGMGFPTEDILQWGQLCYATTRCLPISSKRWRSSIYLCASSNNNYHGFYGCLICTSLISWKLLQTLWLAYVILILVVVVEYFQYSESNKMQFLPSVLHLLLLCCILLLCWLYMYTR